MGKTIMGAVVSLDGFMADDNDGVGPLFDWLGNGDVAWRFPGAEYEAITTQASADFMLSQYADMAANVIGRRVFDLTNGWFDLTNGWNGKPAAGEHVFVVTHQPPTDWEYADTAPFTFVGSGRPFFATGGLAEPLRLENLSTIVRGDRVTHLVYDVGR